MEPRLISFASQMTIFFAALALSTHAYAIAATQSQNGSVPSAAYLPITHFPDGAAPTIHQPEIPRAAPGLNGPSAHSAIAMSEELTEWYGGLGRHQKAFGVEILLIGCYIALRIYSKRRKQGLRNEPAQNSNDLADVSHGEGLFQRHTNTT
jgi:hypothetical protein